MSALATHWHSAWQSLSGNASTAHLPWLVPVSYTHLTLPTIYSV